MDFTFSEKMKNKREFWIQVALFPFLLLASSLLSVSLGYGEFTIPKVFSTIISAVTFTPGYLEVLFLPVALLLVYNFVAGVIWTSMKTYKYRKELSIRSLPKSPISLLVTFCVVGYGILGVGRKIEEKRTEELLGSLFRDTPDRSIHDYETRLSPPLDESIFSNQIQEMRIEGDYSLIRLNDGSTLLAVVNENKKRIVLTKN